MPAAGHANVPQHGRPGAGAEQQATYSCLQSTQQCPVQHTKPSPSPQQLNRPSASPGQHGAPQRTPAGASPQSTAQRRKPNLISKPSPPPQQVAQPFGAATEIRTEQSAAAKACRPGLHRHMVDAAEPSGRTDDATTSVENLRHGSMHTRLSVPVQPHGVCPGSAMSKEPHCYRAAMTQRMATLHGHLLGAMPIIPLADEICFIVRLIALHKPGTPAQTREGGISHVQGKEEVPGLRQAELDGCQGSADSTCTSESVHGSCGVHPCACCVPSDRVPDLSLRTTDEAAAYACTVLQQAGGSCMILCHAAYAAPSMCICTSDAQASHWSKSCKVAPGTKAIRPCQSSG